MKHNKPNKFRDALSAAYADDCGIIIAANRAYRAAFRAGNTQLTETFRRALWQLLRAGKYIGA